HSYRTALSLPLVAWPGILYTLFCINHQTQTSQSM
uniref:Uncharacterized protein n=1 Tax=Amphimedon queenslandica TaxID=400682 RepID=A0A1X7V147_AMPQE